MAEQTLAREQLGELLRLVEANLVELLEGSPVLDDLRAAEDAGDRKVDAIFAIEKLDDPPSLQQLGFRRFAPAMIEVRVLLRDQRG